MRKYGLRLALLIAFVSPGQWGLAEPVRQEAKESVGYLLQLNPTAITATSESPVLEAHYAGTTFAASYDYGGKVVQFLVTARHVVFDENHKARRKLIAQFPSDKTSEASLTSLDPDKWVFHKEQDRVDVAIYPGIPKSAKVRRVPSEIWVTQEQLEKNNIAEGDEAFYVGLLPHYPGPSSNVVFGNAKIKGLVSKTTPITRFARLALVGEPVLIEGKTLALLDANNTPGHSGAPVFLWATPSRSANQIVASPRIFGLYGLVSGVLEWSKNLKFVESSNQALDYRSAGVTGIVPVTLIREILESPQGRDAFGVKDP